MDAELQQTIVDGLTWYLVFIVSTSAHEASHAWAGLRLGDPTAARAGQVSLSPVPHIRRSPVGMVVVPILSFVLFRWVVGWGAAPYDPIWADRHPRKSALVSLAGPAANIVLALLAFAALRVGLASGWFSVPASATYSEVVGGEGILGSVGHFLSIVLILNVILAVLNLMPLPPLDGHAAIPLLLPRQMGLRWLDAMRSIGVAGLIIAWLLFSRIMPFVFSGLLAVLHPGTTWS
jgi:Zn-dependent protease